MKNEPYSAKILRIFFWIAIGVTVVAFLLMRFVTEGLAASRIVEFELAKTTTKAQELMQSWGAEGTVRFLNGIYADFIFIIGYVAALFFGCRYMGHLSGHSIFKKAGYVFSFFGIIAGICDTLENIGILYTIQRKVTGWVVHFTYDMAFVKFSLLFIVLLFIIICLFFRGIDKLTANRKSFIL
ncbi:MAG: hypothetical protein ACKVOW_20760 [Chitinophagaceae bacterium]